MDTITFQRNEWRKVYREFSGEYSPREWIDAVIHHNVTRPTTPEAWLAAAYRLRDFTRIRLALRAYIAAGRPLPASMRVAE